MIKDSGSRTEFATGAVRDIQEGKGRCDLMPLEVVSLYLGNKVLSLISDYVKSKETFFLYEALGYFCKEAYDGDPYRMILELSIHFEEGAKKYGEYNWQKGIPENRYIDSAVRHYLKWRSGMKDEDHARAFVWNIVCLIWTIDHKGGDAPEGNAEEVGSAEKIS